MRPVFSVQSLGCMAIGLCGAFYMCGLLSRAEWEALVERIPVEEALGAVTLQLSRAH